MSRSPDPAPDAQARRLGRYELFERIASGGMAAVYLGRALGSGGFERIVAIKICHEHLRENEEFVRMFLDEARLAAKIHHPNVVPTLDASDVDGLYLVMDFVEGGPLLSVIRAALAQGEPVPAPIALKIMTDTLAGLHAAHELTDAAGSPYNIVHRDVSPPNILVGLDGTTRIADFGVAKAAARATETRDGQLKGKIPYMAPEQFEGNASRQTDVFSAGVVLWETLVGKRLFTGKNDVETMRNVLMTTPAAPSTVWATVPTALDAIVLRALDKDPAQRFPTAAAFADALEASGVPIASTRAVTAYLTKMLGPEIETRRGHYRQFMKADVLLTTPAPSSGVTQRKMSDALADLNASHGSQRPIAEAPHAAPVASTNTPSAAATEKPAAPRPSALRAPTRPPVPAPSIAAPVAEKVAPTPAPTKSATPSLRPPSPSTSPAAKLPVAAAPKPSVTTAAKPIVAKTAANPESAPKPTTTAPKPTVSPTPATKPQASSPLPTRPAKATMIGFSQAPLPSRLESSPEPRVAPVPSAAATPPVEAKIPSAEIATPPVTPAAPLPSAAPVVSTPVVTNAPVISATQPVPTASALIATPPIANAPTLEPSPAVPIANVRDSSYASGINEPIVLPTSGFGRREWIVGGALLSVLVGIAVVIGFRSGTRDAQRAAAPIANSVTSAPITPPAAPTVPVAVPPVEPVVPAPSAPTAVIAAPEPTPAPVMAAPEPTPEPVAAAPEPVAAPAPPSTPTVVREPTPAPQPVVHSPAPIAAVHPAATATAPATARTNATTPTASPSTGSSPRPTRDVRGGLRTRPTPGHGYVPDDI